MECGPRSSSGQTLGTMSPLLFLTTALSLAVVANAAGSYGNGYSYAVSGVPQRKVIVKTVRRPYSRKSGTVVFRSPLDSYDEADAFRTADNDVTYEPPYKPAVVTVRKEYVPAVSHRAPKPVHAVRTAPKPVHTVHVAVKPVHEAPKPVYTVHEAPRVHKVVDHVAHVPVYHYDYHVTPECAVVGKQLYNLTVCLDDPHYPTEAVLHELKTHPALTDRLMSDVTYQSADNLVDGLTKAEEEQYTQEHYYGVDAHPDHDIASGYSYSRAYRNEGGYICPSDIFYARIKRAVNTYGEWKVIVNMPDDLVHDPAYKKFVQTSRLENCVHRGAPCSFVDHVPSKCLQKNAFVRLVAYDPKRGLHTDSFKLPTACSCHLSARQLY